MSTHEPDTIGELIADCADIPADLTAAAALPDPRAAAAWEVDEGNLAQVADLDAYV